MKHLFILILTPILAFGTMHLSGCSAASKAAVGTGATIAVGIGSYLLKNGLPFASFILGEAGKEAAILGLQKLDPTTGKVVASDTIMVCNDTLAYLNTGKLPTADIINQTIVASFSKIDPALLEELQQVSGTLGSYVPSANVYLTSTEIGYLIDFITGVRDGATSYLANSNVQVKVKYTTQKYQMKAERNTNKLAIKRGLVNFSPWFSK